MADFIVLNPPADLFVLQLPNLFVNLPINIKKNFYAD